jgi:drug/metabolite transporter (DMT)-like permease
MIQRTQTLWLAFAAACAALSFKFSFYSGNKLSTVPQPSFDKITASSNFILLILTALLVAGCLIIIFLYKNRKQQLWLTITSIAVSLTDIFLYCTETKKYISGTYSLSAIFVFAVPVLLVLAARGIWQDEKLVKSVDRIR